MYEISEDERHFFCGRDEEGAGILRIVHRVIATGADGSRWEHDASFDRPQQAAALADRISASLRSGGALNLAGHWRQIDPVYGSRAYIDGGYEREAMDREREAA